MLSCSNCVPLCNPMDSNQPSFSIFGILQPRILHWVSSSRESSAVGIEPLSPAFAGRFFTIELFEFEFKYWVKIRIYILKSEGNKRFNKKGQQFVHWSWQGFLENWSYLHLYTSSCVCFFLLLFFTYFYLQWILIAVHRLSLVAAGWGATLQLWCVVLSLQWLLLLQGTGSRACGRSSLVQGLSCSRRHVGSSWTKDPAHVFCIGRQILSHWTTKEVPSVSD